MRRLLLTSLSVLALSMSQTLAAESLAQSEYETIAEFAYVNNTTTELNNTPPPEGLYGTVFETVIIRPEYKDFEVIPATYRWIDGEHLDHSTVFEYSPPIIDKITEQVTISEATTELISLPPICRREKDGSLTITGPANREERPIPAITKEHVRWQITTPASITEKTVPNIIRNGATRVIETPAKMTEIVVPALTRQVPRRVVKMTWCPGGRVIPPGERQITCRVLITG